MLQDEVQNALRQFDVLKDRNCWLEEKLLLVEAGERNEYSAC
jgi:hypothetical protein